MKKYNYFKVTNNEKIDPMVRDLQKFFYEKTANKTIHRVIEFAHIKLCRPGQ